MGVANYHDLKKVMDDKKYHLHVDYDRTRLRRDSKIYINNYTGDEDGLDYLRDFYDLSLISGSGGGYTVADNKITATGEGANTHLLNHTLLNNSTETGRNKYDNEETDIKGVKAGTNLEFILRTDINHPDDPAVPNEWTPIASGSNPCFNGNLHGDGHTISGLDNSLFENLCGNVYNLGVTGSFNSAGVADEGIGYVESSWVKTTGTPSNTIRAVFGAPNADSGYKQIVNSYCQAGKDYKTTDTDSHGLATAIPEKSFYNGTLAYDLNNFYLYKRYTNKNGSTDEGSIVGKYYTIEADNSLTLQPYKSYASNQALCSTGYNGIKYVEDRFEDGDFRFAAGSVPSSEDERYYLDREHGDYWYPIWPDDYLFFGQSLNYGYVEGLSHQEVPTAINRFEGRIDNSENSNRVYRAPAYYRSSTMDAAHFNKNAVFAQTKKGDAATIAYKDMTAIDFTGYNDTHVMADGADKPYELGLQSGKFYAPLLDEEGLTGFKNINLTRNLLAYTAPTGTTATTVSKYLTEHEYAESNEGYRRVERKDSTYIHGHWLQQAGDRFITDRDQLLVDLNDFNAPISYTFTSDKRMFYQRIPEDNEFVLSRTMGWQGISIPFSAELVTTNQKGEITHFYDGSEESKNGTNSKIGHEYWLRQYRDISGVSNEEQLEARFTYPTKDDGEYMQKTAKYDASVTSTFLWDYYYKASLGHNHLDYNKDTYQTYYKKARDYSNYPLLTATTPYLIGFPGKTYFEFDLSGGFEASTTAAPTPEKLGKQTITFASKPNISIGVSDTDIASASTASTQNGYIFKPSYMKQSIAAGTNTYTMSATGNSFDKVPDAPGDATIVQPFRPYFLAVGSSTKEYRFKARSIRFNNNGIGELQPEEDTDNEETGNLEIYAQGREIYTVSHLKEKINIRIVNATGATLTTYVLEPGKTVTTPITAPGAYIVNKKKLFIK